MAAMIVLAFGIAARAGAGRRLPAWAGVVAGFVFFMIYVEARPSASAQLVTKSNAVGFLVAGVTALVAFFVLRLLSRIRRAALLGVVTMVIVGLNSIALYAFFYESSLRLTVVQLSLGSVLGVLVYVIFFSEKFKQLFTRPEFAL
ncbi:hypothetical protein [Nocardia asteroides]|uniref:hypothetical protein n=1 Tax=Nocardia asteroides TaxID=1824 RepID=UPI001E581E68|nr:hypothetical protein [Nocardia asteroides]UGT62488.1 hypothetical protein LTT61_03830 [Nocardia asteroides]